MVRTEDVDCKLTSLFMSDKFEFTSQEQKKKNPTACFVWAVKVHSYSHCPTSNCFSYPKSQSLALPNNKKTEALWIGASVVSFAAARVGVT